MNCLKVRCGGGWWWVVGGGGVERHLSVQLWAKLKFWPRPKLNNCSGGRKKDDL